MEVELIDDPAEFRRRAGGFMATEPLSSNVIAVVLDRTIEGVLSPTPDDVWIATVHEGSVVGAAMSNKPYNLFASRQPPGAGRALAEALHAAGRCLPGVTAEAGTSREFSGRWCELTGCRAEVQIHHQAYGLEVLVEPVGIAGTARRAREGDVALLASWLEEFHAEAIPHDPVVDNLELAGRRAAAGEMWVWEHGGSPVAMAACSHPAAGVARVGPVYTPPQQRGRGYAAGATAAASRAAFDEGAGLVMLYADQANPTSNALYARLGFRPDHEAVDFGFRP